MTSCQVIGGRRWLWKSWSKTHLLLPKTFLERQKSWREYLSMKCVSLIWDSQRSLQHENLVRLLGLVIEEGKGGTVKSKIFLVTEFMGKGSLLEYLRSRGRQYVTKKDQIGFAFDTACGMAYLESRWIWRQKCSLNEKIWVAVIFTQACCPSGPGCQECSPLWRWAS